MARVFHREHALGVHPDLLAFLDWWEEAGPFAVTIPPDGGLRDDTTQAALYAKGRTTPGPRAGEKGHPPLGYPVTNAKTVHDTPHGRGAAVDLLPVLASPDGQRVLAVLDSDRSLFQALGGLAQARGLVWGGCFHAPIDLDHVEVPDWKQLPVPKPQGVRNA